MDYSNRAKRGWEEQSYAWGFWDLFLPQDLLKFLGKFLIYLYQIWKNVAFVPQEPVIPDGMKVFLCSAGKNS